MGLLISGLVLLGLTIVTTAGYRLFLIKKNPNEDSEDKLLKKYDFANIFKYRQLIFFTGLLIALIFAWVLIEYKTYYNIATDDNDVVMNVEDEPIEIIITEILPPPPPKPKTVVIEVVPELEIIEDEPLELDDPEDELEPVEEIEDYAEVEEEVVDDRVYDMHELQQTAKFPGGEEALLNYLQTNYQLHSRDIHAGTSGMIQVVFVVEKDGSVSGVKVLRGLTPTANASAEKVVKSLPKWKPAKMGGLPVKMRYMVPIFLSGE